MKKRSMVLGLVLAMGVMLTGCDTGGSDDNDVSYVAGTVKYSDGTVMGVTRAEPMVNGGFQVYDFGTGQPIGFIQVDGSVNNMGGVNLGVCNGAVIGDAGVNGECALPVPNPAIVIPVVPTPQVPQTPQTPQTPQKPQTTVSVSIAAACPSGFFVNAVIIWEARVSTNSKSPITYSWPDGSGGMRYSSIPKVAGTATASVTVTVDGVSATASYSVAVAEELDGSGDVYVD